MRHLTVTAKIWLSIAIFVVGFLLSTALQQVEGLKIEEGLRISAEERFPAARKSHEANTAFHDMVKEYRDAVVIQDADALKRGADEGRRVIASLKSLAAIEPLATDRVATANEMASQVERFVHESQVTYLEALASAND